MDSSNNVQSKTNGFAVAGFVLAFLIPLLGLIFSIIGLTKAKDYKGNGKGLSIAGIIISSILLLFTVLFFMSLASGVNEVAKNGSTNNSGSSTSTKNGAKSIAKLNEAATDGKFEFTVTSLECGKSSVGNNPYLTKEAQGQFCLLNITVKNTGNESQSLFSSNQFVYNATGQKFKADDIATTYMSPDGSTWYSDINPGNSVSGTIVFDLPKDQTPVTAELHDSAFSQGVQVKLQ